MSYRSVAGLSAVVALSAGIGAWTRSQTQDEFDHLRHQRVFPTCDGCHQVQPTEVTIPQPTACFTCHDGEIVRQIDWDGADIRPTNLDFNHAGVIAAKQEALGFAMPCATCHTPRGAERMDVQLVVAESCFSCHAPGTEHYIDAPCAKCHLPLPEARELRVAQLKELPVPSDHAAENFDMGHGAAAQESVERCAVCHARNVCSSCHVNAPSVPAIQDLSPDPRVAEIVAGREVVYPTPDSHRERDWSNIHGEAAADDVSRCSTCHSRSSCLSCHAEPAPEPVQQLPPAAKQGERGVGDGGQERGPGVALERRPPPSHIADFLRDHGASAAASTARCQNCHTTNQCTSCHTASEALTRPGRDVALYHPPNFMQQHSAPAFSQSVECAVCHNPEVFCRDCHAGLGLGTEGGFRFDTGFHNRDTRFVFGHGQAARQALESCAGCHAQSDCLVCHSAKGGRRVNPHGPDFDPERLRSKNANMCLFCHRRSILDR